LKPKLELALDLAVLLAENISLVVSGLLVVDVAGYSPKYGGTTARFGGLKKYIFFNNLVIDPDWAFVCYYVATHD
jgi:hypothetical protein